ncbi:MAG: riboflavin synthase [Hyphomicrobiaceae bacterium]
MFTGIITDVGRIVSRDGGRFEIACGYEAKGIALGASIACDGCCLTVTSVKAEGAGALFTVDVSNESLARTTLGSWQAGRRINLERALALGAELGGHLVTGHVDGVAQILERRADGNSERFVIEAPAALARFIAEKGSVALDGTSLTVNEVEGRRFGINLIPHTLQVTGWGARRAGDPVNIEVDLLARYVARLSAVDAGEARTG